MVPQSFEGRLSEVVRRTEGKVGPEVARQLHALIEPTSLKIVAGIIVVWLGSHAFGVGEAVDLILGFVGFAAIGLAVFDGLDEAVAFARGTMSARTDGDLDRAAGHLASAIGILGIQAVLALLMRGRASTRRGTAINRGTPPPRTPGSRYRASTKGTIALVAGAGKTTFWGDVTISTLGTLEEQRLVFLHKEYTSSSPRLYLCEKRVCREEYIPISAARYTGGSRKRWLRHSRE